MGVQGERRVGLAGRRERAVGACEKSEGEEVGCAGREWLASAASRRMCLSRTGRVPCGRRLVASAGRARLPQEGLTG